MTLDIPTRVRLPETPPDPEPMTWTYEVRSAPPMIVRQMYPDCAPLMEQWATGDRLSREDDEDAERVALPGAFAPVVIGILTQVAEHFGVPYSLSSTRASIARYKPGTHRDWHVDAGPDHPSSSRWTVAFSLLLNDDFAGGDLEVHPSGPVQMSPGDVVGFTSRTPHRVWPVEHGERFVLLGFGGFGGQA